jgi:hypothetical protein
VLESIPLDLLAPVLTLYRQGADDAASTPPCHCELELSGPSGPFVEEEDTTVSLTALWFLDYDASIPTSTRPIQSVPLQGFVNQTLRQVPPFALDADAVGIVTSGIHVVELVIGETTGFDPNSTTLPNRAMLPGFQSTGYKFVVQVNVQQNPNIPRCPDQAPSVRVCQ